MNKIITAINDMKLVLLAIILAGFTQMLANIAKTGDPMILPMFHSLVAMALICFLSLVAKAFLPSSLPAFAYATIIGILLCLPDMALGDYIISSVKKIGFLSCCVPLLIFAGLSVGGQIDELKKMGWKIILIFLLVSTCCFFGASMVAQLGFSAMGVIK